MHIHAHCLFVSGRLHQHCDAGDCSNPKGRENHLPGTPFEIIRCNLCGMKAVHIKCGGLDKASPEFVCEDHEEGKQTLQRRSIKKGRKKKTTKRIQPEEGEAGTSSSPSPIPTPSPATSPPPKTNPSPNPTPAPTSDTSSSSSSSPSSSSSSSSDEVDDEILLRELQLREEQRRKEEAARKAAEVSEKKLRFGF